MRSLDFTLKFNEMLLSRKVRIIKYIFEKDHLVPMWIIECRRAGAELCSQVERLLQ